MRVLLLNSPGRRLYLRDYYCSKVSKAAYLYHPTDLLIQSGILAQRHEIKVIDAIAERWSVEKCLKQIYVWKPDAVLALCGAVSFYEDRDFFRRMKIMLPTLRTILSGDLVLEGATEPWGEDGAIDALLLDFTTADLLKYLEGGQGEEIPNLIYRWDGHWIGGEIRREVNGEFEIPLPSYDLFPLHRYRYPFVRSQSFATVLTDYGCLHHCGFCVMGNLGHKVRAIANVLGELEWLRERGYREIYFNDQTFALQRTRAVELLKAMIGRRFNFGWVCWSRVDRVDEELLLLMKAAGCHTIMFGVESGDDAILRSAGKGFTTAKVQETLQLCARNGVRSVATFLLGLPGQDRASCLRTIDFAKNCGCDFASFNVPVPRPSTGLRQEALEKEWIAGDRFDFDQSGALPGMGNEYLDADSLMQLKRQAHLQFYLRPKFLWKKLMAIRSLEELRRLIHFGLAALR